MGPTPSHFQPWHHRVALIYPFSPGEKEKEGKKKRENTELVRVVWALGDHLGVLVYVLILDDVMFGLILERYRVFPCMGDSHVVSAYMILPVLEKFASSI